MLLITNRQRNKQTDITSLTEGINSISKTNQDKIHFREKENDKFKARLGYGKYLKLWTTDRAPFSPSSETEKA